MTKDKLVGNWHCHQTGLIHELRRDGSGVVSGELTNGVEFDEKFTWTFVDQTHWRLHRDFPPMPDVPGLEDGASESVDYEIVAEDESSMSISEFDVDFPWVWEKLRM